jgi:hypothetical protein
MSEVPWVVKRGGVVCLLCSVLFGLLSGCADGEGGAGGLPTRSPEISPTKTLPAPTRTPTRTDEPTEEPTDEPTEEPSEEPTEEPSEEPTEEPTEEPSEEPTEVTSPTSTPSGEEEAAGEEGESDDESVPAWVWWLLAGVLVAAGVLTWVLVARGRKRRAWQEQLGAAEADVAWLARELLPQLRDSGSLDRVAGGWQVALPRVAAAEDQLTVLESSAPDEVGGARARAMRDAVRQARARIEQVTSHPLQGPWVLQLDESIAQLEAALTADRTGS